MAQDEPAVDAKERILQAAVQLFARQSYAGTGMRELARSADVNLAMVNYYYGSKRDLLLAVIDRYLDLHQQVIDEQVIGATGPIEERLRNAIRGLVELFRREPELMRVVFTEMPYDVPESATHMAERMRAMIAPVFANVMPEVMRASPRHVIPAVMGPSLLGMPVFHFLMRPVLQQALNIEFDEAFYSEFPDRLADLFLYGTIGRPPDPEEHS